MSNDTNGDGWIFGLQQYTGGLKGHVRSMAYEFPATRRWPTSLRGPKVNSRTWLCAVDDSTPDVVMYIIIINSSNISGLQTKLKTITNAGLAAFQPRG